MAQNVDMMGASARTSRGLGSSTLIGVSVVLAAGYMSTAAIREHARTEREVAIEQSRQAHALVVERERGAAQLRLAYVDHANAPSDRHRTLRLILATTQDATLRAWAEGEKSIFDKELADAQKRIEEAEAALAAARAAQAAAPPSPGAERAPAAERPAAARPAASVDDVRLQQARLEEARARQRQIQGDGF
jgi:hypothetical protein